MITHALRRLLRLLASHSREADRVAAVALGLGLGALAAVLVLVGPAPIKGPWDVFILLDGAWRIVRGQVPHVDSHNAIGPLTFLATAFGMTLAPSLKAVVYGNLLVLAGLAPWAWWTGRRRLSTAGAVLFTLFVAFLLLAPRPLGYAVTDTTYAMLYNRYGYALLAILLIGLFAEERDAPSDPGRSGLSTGALAGLLLYCKVSYFAAGFALIAVATLLHARRLRFLSGVAAGLGAVVLAFWGAFRIPPLAYLRDVSDALRAQLPAVRLAKAEEIVSENAMTLYLTAILVGSTAVFATDARARREVRRLWLVAATVAGCGLFVLTGNAPQGTELPAFALLGLLVLDYAARRLRPGDDPASVRQEAVVVLAALIVLPGFFGRVFLRDVACTAYAVGWDAVERPHVAPSQRFEADRLRDFVIPEQTERRTAYWRARDAPRNINEGLALLRRHVAPGTRIFSMSLTNPFSFALGLPPPRGVPVWWDIGFSFSERAFPDGRHLFDDVDVVMVPRLDAATDGCCQPTVALMERLYAEPLSSRFELSEETPHWRLLTRRSGDRTN